ncbi:hypothetical protein [Asticcacaulis sp. AND118]|uniref:hypothetical protein n=1 Tax=Asticcacaulis sp. AND118 TaxID=2840468 RepID=UPI001CFFD9A9|nr:hypothetical protein [Asticcacaulis sp. AND118]UDF04233.1 hypothetical protein LH365_04100 [Asticcacaulis sp. AND118]
MALGGNNGPVEYLSAVVLATGGLGMAASALVDAARAVWPNGGVSSCGYRHLQRVYTALEPALKVALGPDWDGILRGYWINGSPREQNISTVIALVRLGLTAETPQQVLGNLLGHGDVSPVDPEALGRATRFLHEGVPDVIEGETAEPQAVETQKAFDALGRFDALLRARLEAAYDKADHDYRAGSRFAASVVAVGLSLLCAFVLAAYSPIGQSWQLYAMAFGLGILAVPLAPIAKDLTSALKAAASALKTVSNKG